MSAIEQAHVKGIAGVGAHIQYLAKNRIQTENSSLFEGQESGIDE